MKVGLVVFSIKCKKSSILSGKMKSRIMRRAVLEALGIADRSRWSQRSTSPSFHYFPHSSYDFVLYFKLIKEKKFTYISHHFIVRFKTSKQEKQYFFEQILYSNSAARTQTKACWPYLDSRIILMIRDPNDLSDHVFQSMIRNCTSGHWLVFLRLEYKEHVIFLFSWN